MDGDSGGGSQGQGNGQGKGNSGAKGNQGRSDVGEKGSKATDEETAIMLGTIVATQVGVARTKATLAIAVTLVGRAAAIQVVKGRET